jgi:hypothetical protein
MLPCEIGALAVSETAVRQRSVADESRRVTDSAFASEPRRDARSGWAATPRVSFPARLRTGAPGHEKTIGDVAYRVSQY